MGTLKKDIAVLFGISVGDDMTGSEATANEFPKMTIIKDPFLKDVAKNITYKIILYLQSFIRLFF